MTKQQIAELAIKILGIYSIIQAIPFIGGFINAVGFPVEGSLMRVTLILSSVIPFFLLLGIGSCLILSSARIANRIFPKETIEITNKGVNLREIQAVAFSIVGVVLIVLTIPKFFQLGSKIYALLSTAHKIHADLKLSRDTIAFGINLSIQLILGVLLFISGDKLSNIWHSIVRRTHYERNITSG